MSLELSVYDLFRLFCVLNFSFFIFFFSLCMFFNRIKLMFCVFVEFLQ